MNNRMWVLAGSVIAMLIASLDATVMNNAMSYIAHVLGGVHHLFLYGFAASVLALVTAFCVPRAGLPQASGSSAPAAEAGDS